MLAKSHKIVQDVLVALHKRTESVFGLLHSAGYFVRIRNRCEGWMAPQQFVLLQAQGIHPQAQRNLRHPSWWPEHGQTLIRCSKSR